MSVKKIAIMVDELYQVLEVWYPYYRFREAGLEVHLVAAEQWVTETGLATLLQHHLYEQGLELLRRLL